MEKIPYNRKYFKKQIGNIVYKFAHPYDNSAGRGSGFRILNYHSITEGLNGDDWAEMTTPRDLFNAHMQILSDDGYNVASCREAVDHLVSHGEVPPKTVAITFDDGFTDVYSNALPILKKYNFPATIFVVTDYLESPGYMTYAELKEAGKDRLIHLGCHTLSHKKLTFLNEQDFQKEIRVSKKKLEDATARPISLFAYPFGSFDSFNEKIIEFVRKAGFVGALTSIFGPNMPGDDSFLLKRNRISWHDNEREFKKHLAGAYDWYAKWQRIIS